MIELTEEKSYTELITELRKQAKSEDPKVSEPAKQVLNDMWNTWATDVKKRSRERIKRKQKKQFIFR